MMFTLDELQKIRVAIVLARHSLKRQLASQFVNEIDKAIIEEEVKGLDELIISVLNNMIDLQEEEEK